MKPCSEHMKDLLVEKGVGKFAATGEAQWGIFVGSEPSQPDNVITVYDVPGVVQKTMSEPNHFFQSGFQVRVRSRDYLTAHAKTEECRKALDRIGKFEKDGIWYDNVTMDDEPLPLGEDNNNRRIFVVNGTAYRQEKPEG